MRQLPVLVGVFAYLSLLTIGGGMSAFPEMKSLTVNVYHWLTFSQLIHSIVSVSSPQDPT
jgi:chromate transporter